MRRSKEATSKYNKEYNKKNHKKNRLKMNEWARNNPEMIRAYRLKREYGLTFEQFDQMRNDQNYQCYICKKPETDFKKGLHVDHCHVTGKVRKLLCIRCNNALGFLDDDINKLEKCIQYLKDHS